MNFFKLKEICQLLNGRAYKQEELLSSGKYKVLRVGNFFSDKDYFYSNLDLEENKYCDTGDLLFAWSASFGPKIWNGGKVIYHYHIWKIILSESVDKKYLYYYLFFMSERIKAEGHGGIMIHTTKQEMEERLIPLPPLDEQKRIAAVLDKCTDIIAKRKQQLSALDELVKARFVEMFGNPVANEKSWTTISLDDACDGIGDGLHGTPEYDDNGEYPFINGNNLIDGMIEITSATKMVDKATYRKHYIEITENAIMISINGTLGKTAFYKGEKVMLGKSVCYCNLKPAINREFVYGVMKSDAFTEFLESNSTKSTIKNVGLKAMRGFQLIIPPDELQLQFVEFAKQVDKSKKIVKKSLEKSQLLFDSLMQEYFG